MKRNKRIWRKLGNNMVHYGISVVLVLLAGIIFIILNTIELSEKKPVTLIRMGTTYKAYVPNGVLSTQSDSLVVDLEGGERLPFRISVIKNEPAHLVLSLYPEEQTKTDNAFKGNSLLNGFIFTERIKLIQLVFRKKQ